MQCTQAKRRFDEATGERAGHAPVVRKLCFDGDTAVQVPDNKPVKVANAKSGAAAAISTTIAIKNIKAGQKVFARDEVSGKTVVARVKEVFVRTSDHLITIEFAVAKGKDAKTVEVLKTTRQHPFYVDGKGWVPAGGLGIGNAIVTRAGPRLFVKSIKWARRAEGYTVFNFEVESLSGREADGKNAHSYFVGKHSGGAWVHNANYGRIQSRINLQRDPTAREGIDHVLAAHLRPGGRKSQFGMNADEIKQLLQSKSVVSSPVTPLDATRYVRRVDVGRTIGWDMNNGNSPTQWLTVITNAKGNLLTALPGIL